MADGADIAQGKNHRYEILHIKFTWICLAVGFAYVLITKYLSIADVVKIREGQINNVLFTAFVFVIAGLLNILKYYVWNEKNLVMSDRVYITSKIVELVIYSFLIVYINIGHWAYVTILFAILTTSLTKGSRLGLTLVGWSFAIQLFMLLTAKFIGGTGLDLPVYFLRPEFVLLIFLYIMFALFAILCGKIQEDIENRENENRNLVEKLREKYVLLNAAQEETKQHYEMLKETNTKLEEANKKLTDKVAELYTLQQISQAIGSIFDIKELLKYVNDIIIGVMGVSYSTIILYDEKKGRLKVHTTNITCPEHIAHIENSVNCRILMDAMNHGRTIIENYVNPTEYVFTKGRNVKSLICIPLSTKSQKLGLALIEHKYSNAFDDSNVRLLDIICQQVGIALENAELYQKMRELANRDFLTGVYNRLYIRDVLEKEFNYAVLENYKISLAIFDIDSFKRFNDTFGHLFGDKVLKAVAECVQSSLDPNDIIARFGGEEFVILFPRTGLDEACEKVEAIRQKISRMPIKDELVTAFVTASFGVSCYPDCASSEIELLRTADNALYEAKASGRNLIRAARKSKVTMQGQSLN